MSYYIVLQVTMATEPHRLLKNLWVLLRTITPVAALLRFHGCINLW